MLYWMYEPYDEKMLETVASWPEENQEELAEVVAREIEARRTGALSPGEDAAIRRGIAQLDRGDSLSEEEMKVFWKRCGVL